MAKKKIYLSATAAIAASLFGADQVDAATHKIKSGDTLWSLAQKYDTTVSELKKLNNLSSDLIVVNKTLEVGDGKGTSTSKASNSSKPSTSSSSSSSKSGSGSYTVKSGDTLSAIAAKHGTTVNKLMSANNLSSTMIYPGDKLSVNGSAKNNASSSSNKNSSNSNKASSSNGSATTYTVKSGDTLGHIASKHGVSVNNLKSWNNLSSHLIFPGDKLSINGNSASSNKSSSSSSNSSSNSSNNSSSNSASTSGSTYTVKSGDSLSGIASKHGVSVNSLMSWNNLSSTLIFPGDKLAIREGAKGSTQNNSSATNNTSTSKPANNANANKSSSSSNSGGLISTAKSVQGTPYVWGGTSPNGFDCSGFIHWAHKTSGAKDIPRMSVAGYDSRAYEVSNPQVGDLVFFKGTYGGPNHMSHMGIYLGGGNFIHASSSQGVSIANVNNSYWSKHFDSYKRFY